MQRPIPLPFSAYLRALGTVGLLEARQAICVWKESAFTELVPGLLYSPRSRLPPPFVGFSVGSPEFTVKS